MEGAPWSDLVVAEEPEPQIVHFILGTLLGGGLDMPLGLDIGLIIIVHGHIEGV